MNFRFHCVLLALIGEIGCAPTLSGRLISKAGDPISSEDGSVNITKLDRNIDSDKKQSKDDGRAMRVVALTGSGEFKIELTPGTYLVETFVPDFAAASQRIIFETSSLELRFVLERLPIQRPKAVGANLGVDAARGAGAATLTPPQL